MKSFITTLAIMLSLPTVAQTTIKLPFVGEREADNEPSISVYLPAAVCHHTYTRLSSHI